MKIKRFLRKKRRFFGKKLKNFSENMRFVRANFSRRKERFSLRFSKFKNRILELKSRKQEKIRLIGSFIIFILGYGLMVNFMLWSLFGFKMNLYTFLGYGIASYLIREEFTIWIRRIIFRK